MNKPRSLGTISPAKRSVSDEATGSSNSTSNESETAGFEEFAFDFESLNGRSKTCRSKTGKTQKSTKQKSSTTKRENESRKNRAAAVVAPVSLTRPDKLKTKGRAVRMPAKSRDQLTTKIEAKEDDDQDVLKRSLLAAIPSWMISTAFHLLLLTMLALVVMPNSTPPTLVEIELSKLTPEMDAALIEMEVEDLADAVSVDPEFQMMAEAASNEVVDVLHDEGVMASLEEFNGMGDAAFESYATGDAPNNLDNGGKATEQGDGAGGDQGTNFFGAEAYGRRFVFVIDGSRSMLDDGRWQQMVEEVVQSVNVLTEEEEIFVMLYSNLTYPMLNIAPADIKLTPVTEEFKQAFFGWLSFQRPDGGTRPAHAMQVALALEPDAIFLLSDGMLDDNTVQVLMEKNVEREWPNGDMEKTPVHTITLGARSGGAGVMKFIARTNNGRFRWVK